MTTGIANIELGDSIKYGVYHLAVYDYDECMVAELTPEEARELAEHILKALEAPCK